MCDAAMVDGAASLMTGLYGLRSAGLMDDERGSNVLDGGAHYYDVYKTRDGKYVALAPIEPRFYAALLEALGVHLVDDRAGAAVNLGWL